MSVTAAYTENKEGGVIFLFETILLYCDHIVLMGNSRMNDCAAIFIVEI